MNDIVQSTVVFGGTMKSINYKLIVSDFDGTLAKSDTTVSEKNIEAINEYIDAGGIFAVSTGRLPSAILPQVRGLGLKGVLCCCNGAIILDIESGDILFEGRLPFDTTLSACLKMEEMGLHIHAFDLWDYYSNKDNDMLRYYEKLAGVKAERITNQKLSEFLSERKMSVYKLIALVDAADNAKISSELSEAKIPNCTVTKSMDLLVEVVNDKLSKGSSLSFLANHFGVDYEKTIAVGDNCNDISMIERAGLGIAVNNAEEALKEKADYVCENNNDNSAIAEVIEKFGFCQINK